MAEKTIFQTKTLMTEFVFVKLNFLPCLEIAFDCFKGILVSLLSASKNLETKLSN